jgi:hypothetical protein
VTLEEDSPTTSEVSTVSQSDRQIDLTMQKGAQGTRHGEQEIPLQQPKTDHHELANTTEKKSMEDDIIGQRLAHCFTRTTGRLEMFVNAAELKLGRHQVSGCEKRQLNKEVL